MAASFITAGLRDDGSVNTEATNTKYNSTSKASTKGNGSLDKDAFLQLLVAEMSNQDPLEPSSNTEYVAQLATFSQVEELQNVGNSISQSQASSLIGKVVIMNTLNSTGQNSYIDGVVQRVLVKDGTTYLGVNDSLYDINDLYSVVDEDYFKQVGKDGLME